jgi:hypothetical protein
MKTIDRKTGELIELPHEPPAGAIRADDAAARLGLTWPQLAALKSVLRLTPVWIDADGWSWLAASELGRLRQALADRGDLPPAGFILTAEPPPQE